MAIVTVVAEMPVVVFAAIPIVALFALVRGVAVPVVPDPLGPMVATTRSRARSCR
jgi:hypothetical protein